MATKRTRQSRTPDGMISADAVDLYRRGLALVAGRTKCIESNKMCTHSECAEYHRISLELDMLLHISPHQPSPLDAGPWPWDPEPWEAIAPIKAALERAIKPSH